MKYLDTIPDLERASKLFRARVWTERAYIHRKQSRYAEAVDCARKALVLDANSVAALAQLSRAYEGLGKPDLAYEALLDSVAITPSLATDYSERLRKLRDQIRE